MKKNFVLIILSILFFGSMKAQNHYTPAGEVGTNVFGVWANVVLDGEVQTSNDIEVGMFYDDVCVKTQRIKSYFGGQIPGAVNLSFAADAGTVVTFKLYNHAALEELVNCSFTTTTPDKDTIVGSPAERIDLEFAHTYAIAASATEGGTVTGAGTYAHGVSVTLTATPSEGYNFVNWTENGEEVSTDAEYTFTVTGARTLVANFEKAPYGPAYPWTVNPNEYSGNGYMVALVQINGVTITDGTNWEVGAFNGTHCNGVANMDNYSWVDTSDDPDTPYDYYLFLMLYGSGGEQLDFYLYDREAGETVEAVCDVTVTYTNDCEFGDFWEPYILNFVTTQTHTKDIIGYGDGDGHYYLIASPIGEVNPNEVGDMFKYPHDLYYFDQNQELEWINIRDGNTNLVPGKGYLYASKEDVTITFYGSGYNGSGDVVLVKDASDNPDGGFEGWNLVGNPFDTTAYITERGFYTMNVDGSEIIPVTGNSVEAMEGIFVIAEEDGEILTFSTAEPSKAPSQLVLNVFQRGGNTIDRAIVRFGQSKMLPKFMLNENNTKMYISKDDQDFAIVRGNRNDRLPVSFEPAEEGVYFINVDVENVEVRYLHLIDHVECVDIDLLQNPTYKFEAKATEKPNRFELVFRTGSDKELLSSRDEDSFGFCNNGNWIINNEGEAILQVVDVEGRILSSEEINGSVSKRIEAAPGVYMLRLINGKDMKVQKIVVE